MPRSRAVPRTKNALARSVLLRIPMRSSWWLIGCAISFALAGNATTQAGAETKLRAMTLPDALAYAAEHQPSLLAARARFQAAQRDAEVPRGLWYPRVGATAQILGGTTNNTTASYVGTAYLDIPRIGGTRQAPPIVWQPYASSLAGVGVRQELFDFGRIGALEAAYDAAAQAEGSRADADRLDVALTVEETYFAVHAGKAVLQAAEQATQRAGLHRDESAAGVKSGLRSPIELTRAEADLSRFEVAKVRATGGLEVAQAIFAAAVGVPESRLDAAGAPAEPPAFSASAFPGAADRDPVVREAIARLQAQRAQTLVAEAELRPDLFITAGANARAGGAPASGAEGALGKGFIPDVPNWNAALVLSWPLYDRSSVAKAEASRVREVERAAEVSLARQRVNGALQAVFASYQVAGEALPALERSVAAAQANHAQAEARFKAGLGSSLELADAEALRVQAEIDFAIGRFEQARARARLGRAVSEVP